MNVSNENKEKVKALLQNCDKTGLVFTCRKCTTDYGLESCANRLIELIAQYPSWTIDQCLGQLEVELGDQNYQ
jgi:hypothetical protein